MKKTKTDSKERKVKDSIQSICVNEQLRYQRKPRPKARTGEGEIEGKATK